MLHDDNFMMLDGTRSRSLANLVVIICFNRQGIAALGVVCLATFKPYTVAYDQLLNITCCCMGDFCTMVEDSLTVSFQLGRLIECTVSILVAECSFVMNKACTPFNVCRYP